MTRSSRTKTKPQALPEPTDDELREIEAALVAEVEAAIAALPHMSDEPDDIPF
jgi:hypothetical protein